MSVAVGIETPVAVPERALRAVARDYLSLTKPRIIVLLEVTAFAAMVMAARGWPGTWRVVVTLLGGALAAGGANTINMWFDRDIDRTMTRTCGRPIASGRIGASPALGFGIGLGVAGFAELALFANLLAAVLATSALLFYVLVYTMYLKRSTMQNIVVGGAAGAVPPLVGWAAVTGRLDLTALLLFAVVFYWTPPHFWALALLIRGDYARAGVPMLPVVAGVRRTQRLIVLYSLVMVLVTVLPLLAGSFSWIYLGGAAVLDAVFVADALRVLRDPTPRAARRLFHYSLLYLALLFAVMAADRIVIPG
ncbi:MAG: protoheme IX farnesyltransferase [Chloroflexi bacterium]|nr:MAG: protoheme IX farnesyltransferase [Chloroflexota bacterium]